MNELIYFNEQSFKRFKADLEATRKVMQRVVDMYALMGVNEYGYPKDYQEFRHLQTDPKLFAIHKFNAIKTETKHVDFTSKIVTIGYTPVQAHKAKEMFSLPPVIDQIADFIESNRRRFTNPDCFGFTLTGSSITVSIIQSKLDEKKESYCFYTQSSAQEEELKKVNDLIDQIKGLAAYRDGVSVKDLLRLVFENTELRPNVKYIQGVTRKGTYLG